jgi:hypothetical protein
MGLIVVNCLMLPQEAEEYGLPWQGASKPLAVTTTTKGGTPEHT